MCNAVALGAYGEVAIGIYDGYGRMKTKTGEVAIVYFDGIEVWHRKCWKAAGEPSWSGESHSSDCQGFYFGCEAHDYAYPPSPTPQHYPKEKEITAKPPKGTQRRLLDEAAEEMIKAGYKERLFR
jgi:hypothetical protein